MWIFRLALWIFVLGFAAVIGALGHWGIRSSTYYRDAVDRQLVLNPALRRDDIRLCVFCTYRIGREGRDTRYEFTLVVDHGGRTEKIRIRGTAPRY